MNNTAKNGAEKSVLKEYLVCTSSTGGGFRLSPERYPILSEDSNGICIKNGESMIVDSVSMTAVTEGAEESFIRQIDVMRAGKIVIKNLGIVSLSDALFINGREVRKVSVDSARVDIGGLEVNFSAIAHLVGEDEALSPTSRFSVTSENQGHRVLITLTDTIQEVILKKVVNQNRNATEALKKPIREFILEAIKEFFPNKGGYLNNNEIKVLYAKIKDKSSVVEVDKPDLMSFIEITVNNHEKYKQLYNSRRETESHL